MSLDETYGNFIEVNFDDLKLLCKRLDDVHNNGKIYKVSDKGYLMTPTNRIIPGVKKLKGKQYVYEFNMYTKSVPASRLVAYYFCERPKDISLSDLIVIHIDGDTCNNNANNLIWK